MIHIKIPGGYVRFTENGYRLVVSKKDASCFLKKEIALEKCRNFNLNSFKLEKDNS